MAKLSCTVELHGKTYVSPGFLKRDAVLLFSALNSCSGLDLVGALSDGMKGVTLQRYAIEEAEMTADYILNRMFPGEGLKVQDMDMEEVTALFTAMAPGLLGAQAQSEPEPDPAAFEYLQTVFSDEETIAANYARKETDHHPDAVFKGLKAIKYLAERSAELAIIPDILTEAEGLTGIEYSTLSRYYTMSTAQLEHIRNGPRSKESFSPEILGHSIQTLPEADRAT